MTTNSCDREVGPIHTFAGTGTASYRGDGGPAIQAGLDQPFHCSKNRRGDLYVVDTNNHCIRKIDAQTRVIATVAGCGRKGYTGDGGPATAATMDEPYGVLPDAENNLFIIDRLNGVVRRVDAKSGIITTCAGTGEKGYSGDGGPANRAMLREPNALDFDPSGDLYIADVSDCRVRKIDHRTSIISTVSGTGRKEFAGDGGPASAASIQGARGVAFAPDGTMYICEREGNRIRRVDAKTRIITTIGGTGEKGYSGDGSPAIGATFNGPKWIQVGPDGGIYVVDTENHCVRRIDPVTNIVMTIAGGHKGGDGDGGRANDAGMARPHGCWLDDQGNLFVADTNNHRVRVSRDR